MRHQPRGSWALLAIAVLLVSCATGAPTHGNVHAAIESANKQWMETFSGGDPAQLATFYTPDAQLLPPNSAVVTGRQAIQQYWQGAMAAGLKSVMLATLEVEARGDTAYEVGKYTIPGEGGKVMDAGKYIVIWKREGGGWKLHRDIWNSDLP